MRLRADRCQATIKPGSRISAGICLPSRDVPLLAPSGGLLRNLNSAIGLCQSGKCYRPANPMLAKSAIIRLKNSPHALTASDRLLESRVSQGNAASSRPTWEGRVLVAVPQGLAFLPDCVRIDFRLRRVAFERADHLVGVKILAKCSFGPLPASSTSQE